MLSDRSAAVLLMLLVTSAKAQQVYTITEWPSMCSAIYTSGTQSVTVVQSTVTQTVSPTPFSDLAANSGTSFVLEANQQSNTGDVKRQTQTGYYVMPNGNTTADPTLAAQYYIYNGQLRLSSGQGYSTEPNVIYQPFAASSQGTGTIFTDFAVQGGQLTWSNSSFASDGTALFFITPSTGGVNAEIIVAFASQGANTPLSWGTIQLTARAVRDVVPGSYSNSQTMSVVTSIIMPESSLPAYYGSTGPAFTFAPTTTASPSSSIPPTLQSLSTITAPGSPLGPIRPSVLMSTDADTTSMSSSDSGQPPVYSMATSSSSSSQDAPPIYSVTSSSSSSSQAPPLYSVTSAAASSLSTSSTGTSSSSTTSASIPSVYSAPSSSGGLSTSSALSSSQIPPVYQASSTSSPAASVYQTSSSSSQPATSSSPVSSAIQSLATYPASTSSAPGAYTSSAPASSSSVAATTYTCPAVDGTTVYDSWGVAYIIACGRDTSNGNYDSPAAANSWNDCFSACHNSITTQGVGRCTAFTYFGAANGAGSGTCFLKDQGGIMFTGSGSDLVAAIQVAYYNSTSPSSSTIASTSSSSVISTSSSVALTSSTSSIRSTTSTISSTTNPALAYQSTASSTSTRSSSSSSSNYLVLASPTPCDFGDPTGTDEDDSYCEIDLPFSMTMYTVNAPQTFASTNGYISMVNGSSQYQANPLPFSGIPATSVLPLFDDLFIYGAASPPQGIFYQTNATGVTYEYYLGRNNVSSSVITHFTVGYSTLTPGVFTYTYYNVGNGYNGNTSSVGSQGLSATYGGSAIAAQYSYDTASVPPGAVIVCNTNANTCTRTQ